MGKGSKFFFLRHTNRRGRAKKPPPGGTGNQPSLPLTQISEHGNGTPRASLSMNLKKKAAGGARLWMRLDRTGQSEAMECDKGTIIKRASLPPRDLRILGPVFSQTSSIHAREKAMIVNLEFIKAIITADEVLLLDPLQQEVLPFVDQLRQQLPNHKPQEGDQLPFEFRVLEIALEIVCTYLDSDVADLEREAYPVIDKLSKKVTNKILEHVRSLKSNLTYLLARVQKTRDEIEHILDDYHVMAQMYLTRKSKATFLGGGADGSVMVHHGGRARFHHHRHHRGSKKSRSVISSNYNTNEHENVDELEMLLEAYYLQLDGTRSKILSIREYIDDTEDYVNIQLDNQRNQLIQLELTLIIGELAIVVENYVAGVLGVNQQYSLFDVEGIFLETMAWMTALGVLVFLILMAYARWKKLIGF